MKVVRSSAVLIAGTLVAWASGPGIVLTTQPKVVAALNDLAADPRNIVYVMSGETTSVYDLVTCTDCRRWINCSDKVQILA
jgi:trehalose-6-phosphatase